MSEHTIYKYNLEITDTQEIPLLDAGRIISAGIDPTGQMCVWAEVPLDTVAVPAGQGRTIRIIGTGNAAGDLSRLNFIDTVRVGSFMWHVYEA